MTHPMEWETIVKKFEQLNGERVSASLQHKIETTVDQLEDISVNKLTGLLEKAK